jgi:hypothetical protein
MALDNRWPRNENTWQLSKSDGALSATIPADLDAPSIISLISADNRRLIYMSYENVEDSFYVGDPASVGVPVYWTAWQGQLWFMPSPGSSGVFSFNVRGYRQPVWSDGASSIPDIDARLHPALCYYAMGLSYAAQEDEVLEGVYMARWERDCRGLMQAILQPPRHRPLVMGGGGSMGGYPAYVINPPASSG